MCVRCVVSMSMCDNRKRRSVTQKHSKRVPCGCLRACAACAFFFFTDTAGKKQGETGRRRGQKREGTSEGREVVRKLCKNRKGRERGGRAEEEGWCVIVCGGIFWEDCGYLWAPPPLAAWWGEEIFISATRDMTDKTPCAPSPCLLIQ